MNVSYTVEDVTAILEGSGNLCLSVFGMDGMYGWQVFQVKPRAILEGKDGYKTKTRCLKAARAAFRRIADKRGQCD